jgi:glycosyltransferase involved in cell wall biosynthesis
VIDDGSTDDTARLVSGLGFLCHPQPENAGLTDAYTFAEMYARENKYTHILSLDGDGQHDPRFIPAFLEAMTRFDLVSGNRFHDPGQLPDPKIASNLFAILLFREALNIILPDVSCGFRGWKTGMFRDQAGRMGETAGSRRYGVVYEMLLKHTREGKPTGFVKIPAIYHKNDPLNTKIPEIIGLLSMVVRYKNSGAIQSILDHVLNKRNFSINLSGFRFDARVVSADAYVFETEMTNARQFLRSNHNQPEDEHKI